MPAREGRQVAIRQKRWKVQLKELSDVPITPHCRDYRYGDAQCRVVGKRGVPTCDPVPRAGRRLAEWSNAQERPLGSRLEQKHHTVRERHQKAVIAARRGRGCQQRF